MSSSNDKYEELCYYSLSHTGADFIHQHVVDALGAQEASPSDKPIRLVFALVGLYLHVEKGFTGREVQLAHMKLGQHKQSWPILTIPANRGAINTATVLSVPICDRDKLIHDWCRSVWLAFAGHRETIKQLIDNHKIVDSRSLKRNSRAKN